MTRPPRIGVLAFKADLTLDGASFHPELTGVHELLLDLVEEAAVVRTQ